eukprot:TRINITY_DN46_c0_g1_i1.p1 TRINITY_DN46_c0_g1~~TRINITY_DN46_c0_g1_i1.p1  ORF type:complete len:256 (+),score=98.30 TRINITY_DN46_c0_g1_i1:69-836(+)
MSEAEMKQLDGRLADRSYVAGGWRPARDDAEEFARIGAAPDARKFANVARWYKHIASYSPEERAAFPAAEVAPAPAAAPAATATAPPAAAVTTPAAPAPAAEETPGAVEPEKAPEEKKEEKPAEENKPKEEAEDDFDVFADVTDKEKADADKAKADADAAKKANAKVCKSRVVFDVAPCDDETDMADLEKVVRDIAMEGLLWGKSELVPVAFGIKKLQIVAIIVDDLVSTDAIEEELTQHEDVIQSVDIVSFNKL